MTKPRSILPILAAACLTGSQPAPSQEPSPVQPPAPPLPEQADEPGLAPVPWLGVSAREIDELVRQQLPGLKHGGISVDFVMPNSPAEKAGLRQHDILCRLDDQLLFTPRQLALLIQSLEIGRDTRVHLLRQGKPLEVDVTLGQHLPGTPSAASLPRYPGQIPPGLFAEFPQLEEVLRRQPKTGMPGFRSSVIHLGKFEISSHDEDGSVEIALQDGKEQVRITDTQGALLFEGTRQEAEKPGGTSEAWLSKISALTSLYRDSGLPWPLRAEEGGPAQR